MGIFDKLFKSEFSTKNIEIINALKILQNSSLSSSERAAALTKLISIFLRSVDKGDLKAILQPLLMTIKNDRSIEVRESALKSLDTIIDNCLFSYYNSPQQAGPQLKLSLLADHSVPILMEVTQYKREHASEIRRMVFGTLSKIAPFAVSDERLTFFALSMNDPNDGIRQAVMSTFENLMKSGNDALKRRIARFSLSALSKALNDSALWVRAARVIGGLGKYGLGAAPFLYTRLDDQEGEWAAQALRNVTGEQYGKDEKDKWEKWLKKTVVE
jgi:hypothetical protein